MQSDYFRYPGAVASANFHPMRVLLRDVATGRLLTHTGGWTADPAKALDFRKTTRAIHYAFESRVHLTRVEILYDFGNPEFDIHIPLRWPSYSTSLPKASPY